MRLKCTIAALNLAVALVRQTAGEIGSGQTPPSPDPQPIEVIELPLPSVAPTDDEGSCTPELNPHRTGCMGRESVLFSGNFLPDSKHVLAFLNFTGAPAFPDSASIYTGSQLIIVKIDGTTFPGSDPWKCITCGVPDENQRGSNEGWDYPEAFKDGKRVLVGSNIVDCGAADLASSECTPEKIHVYPIRLNNKADGPGPGGSTRELRIHPDDYCYFSWLEFNPSPSSGLPVTPRYDLLNVTRLHRPANPHVIVAEGSEIRINSDALIVGELHGFRKIRRLTSHPEYVDPVDISPDDIWSVVMVARGTDRQMWLSAMRDIPSLTDLVSVSAVASTWNNVDGDSFNQGLLTVMKLNTAGDGNLGSINHPEWNERADRKWSSDETRIAYSQELTLPPDCGGQNPLPYPNSTANGGRVVRLMLAHLTNRRPLHLEPVETHSEVITWGKQYQPGDLDPERSLLPAGVYTLLGKFSGFAAVEIISNDAESAIHTVAVGYKNFLTIESTPSEAVRKSQTTRSFTTVHVDWYSDLTSTGQSSGAKKTSLFGFHLDIDIMKNMFNANDTLTTTIDGHV
ncbi:hypothetical protein BJ875DRAFT_515138 [Amylocarpus encephaloides]|uniref:Saponin hydrolase n=1 Tax=Amylocarpus encephaloides TaxID=45428 RepID=A0A9P7YF38_9HELO|nr:hypothetical protein BJ875DRAFT_515138 [Amylocarpus encephaloides]